MANLKLDHCSADPETTTTETQSVVNCTGKDCATMTTTMAAGAAAENDSKYCANTVRVLHMELMFNV